MNAIKSSKTACFASGLRVTFIGQESITLSIRIESISAALEPVRNQVPAPVPVLSNRAGDSGRSLWGINLRNTDKGVARERYHKQVISP